MGMRCRADTQLHVVNLVRTAVLVTGLRANKQLSFADWKNGRCYRVNKPLGVPHALQQTFERMGHGQNPMCYRATSSGAA